MAGILNIQKKPLLNKPEINLKKIEHYIKKHANKKLDLVVLPEYFSTGICPEYFTTHPVNENGGEIIAFIKELAKKYNTNIIAGTVIEKKEDKLYNTSFAINRQGEIIGKYRKIHLFKYLGGTENETITAGEKEVIIDFDFGKVGIAICFDIRYPMLFKKLVKMGADIIVLPTAWAIPNEIYNDSESLKYAQDMWIAMARTRAYDNTAFIVISNQTKKSNEQFSCIGNSLIVSPTAEIIANEKNQEGAIYSDIDLQTIKYLRQICPIAIID